jgi:hypothetical protein
MPCVSMRGLFEIIVAGQLLGYGLSIVAGVKLA